MSFAFDIIEQYEDSGIIEAAVRDCIVPATSALSHLDVAKDEASVIRFWKDISLSVIDEPTGRFMKCYYNDELLGYGFAFSDIDGLRFPQADGNDTVFYCVGGFYGNINGSRSYTFKPDWWVALADHVRGMGYEQLWFSVSEGGTLERCCEIVSHKLPYECHFDNDPTEGYLLFKLAL